MIVGEMIYYAKSSTNRNPHIAILVLYPYALVCKKRQAISSISVFVYGCLFQALLRAFLYSI